MMDLQLDDVQREIADSCRSLLERELGTQRRRDLGPGEGAVDDALWERCVDLGWLALAVPEASGGLGMGAAEEVLVARELGRFAAPGPFVATMIAAGLLDSTGQPAVRDDLLAGHVRAGFAVGSTGIDVRRGDLVVRPGPTSTRIERALEVEPVDGVDPNSTAVQITAAELVVEAPGTRGLVHSQVLLAAHLVGVVEAVRDSSAEYARTRVQFGKPIGAFQAVKHRCADMAVSAYAVRAQVFVAATMLAAAHCDAAFHAASAYHLAVDAARQATADNVQNHGGIGYTAEHDCHHYLKRALLVEFILDRSDVRRALLEQGPTHSSIPAGGRVGPTVRTLDIDRRDS